MRENLVNQRCLVWLLCGPVWRVCLGRGWGFARGEKEGLSSQLFDKFMKNNLLSPINSVRELTEDERAPGVTVVVNTGAKQ